MERTGTCKTGYKLCGVKFCDVSSRGTPFENFNCLGLSCFSRFQLPWLVLLFQYFICVGLCCRFNISFVLTCVALFQYFICVGLCCCLSIPFALACLASVFHLPWLVLLFQYLACLVTLFQYSICLAFLSVAGNCSYVAIFPNSFPFKWPYFSTFNVRNLR